MQLELCAASVQAISLAKKYNFDRIELCQNLENGGTTPSLGMIQYAVNRGIETHVLIRQRAGDFVYTKEEKKVMINDSILSTSIGVKGLVVGSLTEKNEIDEDTLTKMITSISNIDFTFHRAFDDITDWKKAIDLLIQLGFKRILTSGGKTSIDQGFERLKEMIQYADNRIEIMIGGGVNPDNIYRLTSELKPHAIHFSGTILTLKNNSTSLFSSELLEINEEKIKKTLQNLKRK